MRVLVGTWDGAGNLPPILALIEALLGRGHEVLVICHDVQRGQIEAAGATFLRFDTVPQVDHGVPGWQGGDVEAMFANLVATTGADISAAAVRVQPDVALIDCMAPQALSLTQSAGFRTVALVHAPYSFWIEFFGGLCRGPIDGADLALAMTYAAFDRGVTFPPNLHFVGPLRPELGLAPRPRTAADKPFVVASLSTGYQSPGQHDLLQRVCDALGDLDVDALVTTGRGIAPESLRAGPNIVVERRAPHDTVLPGADLLITHGGHGTVMAGIRYGVPMLCLPGGADQPLNARKALELGLGSALEPTATTDDIRGAIHALLADASLSLRVRAFAAEVAGEPLEDAVELIEALHWRK